MGPVKWQTFSFDKAGGPLGLVLKDGEDGRVRIHYVSDQASRQGVPVNSTLAALNGVSVFDKSRDEIIEWIKELGRPLDISVEVLEPGTSSLPSITSPAVSVTSPPALSVTMPPAVSVTTSAASAVQPPAKATPASLAPSAAAKVSVGSHATPQAGSGAEPLEIVDEIFENQRYSNSLQAWGSDTPAFLQDGDPKPWSNRLQTRDTYARIEDVQVRPGWEWIDDTWHKDVDFAAGIGDSDGWIRSSSFPLLAHNLLIRAPSLALKPQRGNRTDLPVRWRRWTRRRRRLPGTLDRLRISGVERGNSIGGYVEELPEAALLHEGWLASPRHTTCAHAQRNAHAHPHPHPHQHPHSHPHSHLPPHPLPPTPIPSYPSLHRWAAQYCLLFATADNQGAVLLMCCTSTP